MKPNTCFFIHSPIEHFVNLQYRSKPQNPLKGVGCISTAIYTFVYALGSQANVEAYILHLSPSILI